MRQDGLRCLGTLRFLEDLLDFVDIFAHRSSTEESVIVLLPEAGLPFDVTRRREGVRLPEIT